MAHTNFHLQILELYLIADGEVGLGHILGIDLMRGILVMWVVVVVCEQVFVDVVVEFLSGRGATLILLILMR
jgi:hypothetical protein